MRFVMRSGKVLIVQLQEEGLNILDALPLIESTIKALKRIRTDKEIENHITAAVSLAGKCKID